MVEVYAVRILSETLFAEKREWLLSSLSAPYRKSFFRYKNTKSAQRSLLGELLSRKVLSQKLKISRNKIAFKKTINGKPFIEAANTHFNISHSGEWVVLAYSDQEVGIDIEIIRPINYRIAERFFSTEEFNALENKQQDEKLEYFFDLWTLKESYLKLLGTGLTKSLNSFTIYFADGNYQFRENDSDSKINIYFKQFSIENGYKLSVCSYNDCFTGKVKIFTPKELVAL
jgi:4'-phosphopantetheinyl transferase